jgi:hypothetical protein
VALGESFPELRDEIYCQLAKQTNDAPEYEGLVRGWQLLAGCCHCFPTNNPELMGTLDDWVVYTLVERGIELVGGLLCSIVPASSRK